MAKEASVSATRRALALTLVVLAALVAFLAVLAIWVNRQALDTDNWTRTSSQLLAQPVVRNQLADRLTDEIFQSVDIEAALRDALPGRAELLAAPAANALRSQVEKTARNTLARPDVQQLWEDANRSAHQQLLAVLDGGGDTVTTRNGVVVLDVSRLLAYLQAQVGIGGRLRKVLPASATQVTVMRSDQLGAAQTGLKILRPLPVILVLASLALFGAALLVAPGWRRRALRAYGLGFVAAGLGALLARSLAGDEFVSSVAHTAAGQPAAEEVWSIATQMLVEVAVATISYGAVMIAGAWLAGPTSWAIAVRRTAAPYWREPAIAYTMLALIIAALVWWAPTPAWRNGPMLIILIALLAAGTEALRRQLAREFPGASRDDAARRRRERWERFTSATRRRGSSLRDSALRTTSGAREAASGRFSASPEDARLAQLERLAQLRATGVLDDEELRAEKARILNGADELTRT